MNKKVNSKAKNNNNTVSNATSSRNSNSTPTYVEPLPESSRPRQDGPGGN